MKRHFYSIFSSVVFTALGLLSFVILSKGLPVEIFGSWIFFSALTNLVNQIRFGLTNSPTLKLIAAADPKESHMINASALRLELEIMAIISVICLSLSVVSGSAFPSSFAVFLLWYPLAGLSGILLNNAMTWLKAKSKFRDIMTLRMVHVVSFIMITLGLLYFQAASLHNLILAYVSANVLGSLLSILMGWDSSRFLLRSSEKMEKTIFELGKRTILGNMGTSMLKSTDVLMLGLYPVVGMVGVAIYAIPFKVLELLELPVKRIAAALSSRISSVQQDGKDQKLKGIITHYMVTMTIVSLLLIALIAIFAPQILDALAGKLYEDHSTIMELILYLLLISGLMLIPDKIANMSMEIISKPQVNTIRALIVCILNIIGDIIAIFYFKSIFGVVFATIFSMTIGAIIGYYCIPLYLRPRLGDVLNELSCIYNRFRLLFDKKRIRKFRT